MSGPILEARNLHHTYAGGVPALAGLDLVVPRGGRLAILGPNGSGKTTLLLHLNGTLRPGQGTIHLDGEPTGYSRAFLARWRARVGLVLQDPEDQLFAATVFEDVSFGPLNMGLSREEARERVTAALASMRIADLADRPTHHLSFGQKKRVAIAGALAMAPSVLLLDEPTAGLDSHGVAHLLAVLDQLADTGTTIVFATHDVDLVYGWADSVALFQGGRTLRQGDPEHVLADSEITRKAHVPLPWILDFGLTARRLGLLAPGLPLPKSRAEALAILRRLAPEKSPPHE